MSEVVVLLPPDGRARIHALLAARGVKVATRDTPTPGDTLLVATPELLDARGLSGRDAPLPPFMLHAGPMPRERVADYLDHPGFVALVARAEAGADVTLAQRLDAFFGAVPTALKNTGADGLSRTVARSADREPILADVEAYLTGAGIRSRVVSRAINAIEELVTNAVYDAPTDAEGRRVHLETDRRQSVSLATGALPVLSVDVVDGRIGVTMQDPFGSLEASAFRNFLARGLRGDFADKAGGAGLGFARIHAAVDELSVLVHRRRWTRIACHIDAAGQRRDPGQRPNGIFVLERG
jgi:hypothetical protein